jgi:hypothetical protein
MVNVCKCVFKNVLKIVWRLRRADRVIPNQVEP